MNLDKCLKEVFRVHFIMSNLKSVVDFDPGLYKKIH